MYTRSLQVFMLSATVFVEHIYFGKSRHAFLVSLADSLSTSLVDVAFTIALMSNKLVMIYFVSSSHRLHSRLNMVRILTKI